MVCYDLKKEKIPGLVDKFMKFTTANNSDQKKIARDFIKELKRKHRTSQQLLIKLISEIIKEYSDANYDPRNQESVSWCKKVSEINNNFSYI